MQAEQLAQYFHESYERLAPEYGYTTRKDSAWYKVPETNRALMVAVASEVLTWMQEQNTPISFERIVEKLTEHIKLEGQLKEMLNNNALIDLLDKQRKHIEALEQVVEIYAKQHGVDPGRIPACQCTACERAREVLASKGEEGS